tara:strand:- start:2317 stop:2496 length:180 start_codon:yes stop_codon:yes gene_type:complete
MAQGFQIKKNNELYKLQEEVTSGWIDVTEPLTRKECIRYYEEHLNDGTSPKRLKIVRVL